MMSMTIMTMKIMIMMIMMMIAMMMMTVKMVILIQEHGGDGAEAKAARVGSASAEGGSMMIIMMISMVWY